MTSSLHTSHNKLVVNLAVCDLLMSIFQGPQTLIALVYKDWVLGVTLCQFHGFITTLFGVAALVTLAVISINR